ncbi:Clp protease N-terminal domain-containing protein [Fodinicola feengrottensis]|uniref:Clp protease N-terminal domain-containing protein n=1 Tax=Fodinicola feengrottensis TaxID=435914 RepID=A0ABN2HW44_9ACTN|nr:Clp protease N-terminal domain-containing protein [Fodinicola feengrottensis]
MADQSTARHPFSVVVKAALDEARRRGDRRTGTEHLVLGLLSAPDTPPARALNVDLATARAALQSLDKAALGSIGIDVADFPPVSVKPLGKRPPLTSAARAALAAAVGATTMRTRRLAPRQLLLTLLESRSPDPAADLLAALGVDGVVVRDRLG